MSESISPIQYTTPQTKGSIVPIFPTPLGSYDFGNLIKPEVIDFIKNDLTYNLNRSNRTSIEGNVLDFPVMKEIKEFCELCVKEYTNTIYDQAFDTTFHITQSWSNITEPNEFHHKHTHPNSIVSGVMYLQTNEDDKIEFVGDPAIHKRITLDSKSFNDYNISFRWFQAWPGKLYLFPSTVPHDVPKLNDGARNRISIAFNTFVKGQLGSNINKTEAHI